MQLVLKNPTINALRNTGAVIYEGKSQLDGKTPIFCVVTFDTENEKTGPMLQSWILRQDVDPVTAVRLGLDRAICGRCGLASGNGCYVNTGQAPRAVFDKWTRGGYPRVHIGDLPALGLGQLIRLGSYGDPIAVPVSTWNALLKNARDWTGYTHQWKWHRNAFRFRSKLMASADSVKERAQAKRLKWRVFRVKRSDQPRLPGETQCPASDEMNNRTNCATCRACNGAEHGRTLDVVIDAHGPKSKRVELYQLSLS